MEFWKVVIVWRPSSCKNIKEISKKENQMEAAEFLHNLKEENMKEISKKEKQTKTEFLRNLT